MASGTSKKTELKLTNVARASLEELRLDYEDFLRQRGLEQFGPNHPPLMRSKARRCATLDEVRAWVQDERRRSSGQTPIDTNKHGQGKPEKTSVPVRVRPGESVSSAELVANAALSLLNLCSYLLKRQIDGLEKEFVEHGAFTEHLYRVRSERRGRAIS